MTSMPLVSIITPTFNHEAYIGQCIESVLGQTHCKWEQIIIDDGSTDKTPEIVSSFKDPRIIYIRQEHMGPYALQNTYNKALSYAQGELIAILEGDDYWHRHNLEFQVRSFDDPDVILSHGRAYRVSSDRKVLTKPDYLPQSVLYNDPVGSVTRHLLVANGFSHSSTIMIRRDALDEIGGFQGNSVLPLVDAPVLMALGLVGKFAYVNEDLGYHRYHPGCITLGYWERVTDMKRYCLNFYKENSHRLRGLSESEIEKSWLKAICHSHLMQGRLALHRRQWKTAKRAFREAMVEPDLKFKLGCFLGLLSATLKVNVLEVAWKLYRGYEIKDLLGELRS